MLSDEVLIERLADDALDIIAPLFHQVFGHPVSPDLLRWKYASGAGESWTARCKTDGEILAHCGVHFRDVLYFGTPIRAAQLVDLMAAPKRAGLRRQGSPFALLNHRILDTFPRADNPDGIAFGFPSSRAMRLGEHLGVYRPVDQWIELGFEARDRLFSPTATEQSCTDDAALAIIDTLWSRMAADFGNHVIGRRDAAYLAKRYFRHPDKTYRVLVCHSRWHRSPIGLAVLAPRSFGHEILDLIGAWNDFPDMLLAVQRWLFRNGGGRLSLMLTSRFANQLKAFSNQFLESEVLIMANPKSSPATLSSLQNSWWLTGGDTDYR